MTWRVQIVGAPHWANVLADLLSAAGIPSSYDEKPHICGGGVRGRLRLLHWALGPTLNPANVVHHVWVSRSQTLAWAIHWRGRPQIMHWLGSDFLSVQRLPRWRRRYWLAAAKTVVTMQLADSPELADEVETLGLGRPRVVRLLPTTLRPRPLPMPPQFAVLSYWSDHTMRFYRGDWVLRLAGEFPSVPFYIVGRCTAVPGASSNVTFLGWVEDMAPWYDRASVLVRLPEHDSTSVMVLEMLARARHAIYSRRFPHCEHVGTYEAAREALSRLLKSNQPNADGPALVAREFNPADSVAGLKAVYDELTRRLAR